MSGTARWSTGLGISGIAAFILGPLMAHFRIVSAMTGFTIFGVGGLLGTLTLIVAAVGAFTTRDTGVGLALGLTTVIAFVAIAVPARKWPAINDITTDTMNPPRFVKAPSLPENRGREMTYPGAAFAKQQEAGYSDLLPLQLDLPPEQALQHVEAAARQMPGWTLTRTDSVEHAVEGVATSRLFRFQDDFVIEVRPHNGRSIVQMRSKSRDGKGDVGANAARIKAFFAKLR